ncbi:hypothetical protein NDU88_002495 [Pleurodeles waltl]|uniref:Secreted protein n=1 Tax=Pleurodeles waltl TaxID=8319 RepID=A0AAV7MNJ4_PLEWA|nr:hypothetical protein NDU88_002495 [Pleurodeles waltl]
MSGCASFRWAVCGISSSQQALRRFPLWKSGAVVQVGRALKFRSHCMRRVNLFLAGSSGVFPDRRAVNFSPRSKLCVEFFLHKESS